MNKKIDSQNRRIAEYLKKATTKGITPLEALTKFDCFRLSARIWDLRHKYGMDIETIHEYRGGKQYARYRLRSEDGKTGTV